MTKQVTRNNLSWAVTSNLGTAIVGGAYAEHSVMPTEAALSDQFGVSRSAVREAVKMLHAKGLVDSRPRLGIRVRESKNWNLLDPDVLSWFKAAPPDAKLALELLELRFAVEPRAAALAAAGGADHAAIVELRSALKRMRAAEDGRDDPLAADVAFHRALLQASGNRFFASLGALIDSALSVSIRLTNSRKGVIAADYDAHAIIAAAIAKGDVEGAETASLELLDEVRALLRAMAEAP